MTPNLRPADVVAWLRQRAERYSEMAEMIEADLGGEAAPAPRRAVMQYGAELPSVERIKRALAGRRLRPAEIAASLGIDDDVGVRMLWTVLTPENGFGKTENGWFYVLDPDEEVPE